MATIMEKLDPYQAWLGLSSDELPANHYSLLGIDPGEGSRDAISRAAEQRMDVVRSHLDGPDAAAARRLLNELTRAAGCLLNPAERVAYDRRLRRAAEAAEEAEAEPAPPASPPISSTSPPISPVASAASSVAETTPESTPAEGHGSAKSRKPLPQAQPLKRPGNDPRWAVSTDAAASPAASHSIAAKAAPQPQNPSGSPAIARPVAAPIQVRSHGHSASHRNRSGIPMWAMFGGLAIAGLVIAAAGWALIGGDGDAGAVPVANANANGASDGGVIDAVAGTATAVAGETSSSDPAGGASSGEPNATQTAATNSDAGPPAGDATDASTLPPPIMPATEPNTTAPGSSTDVAVVEPAPSPIDTPNPTSPVNAPPAAQVPDGANAVRLAGSDGVEIANSDRLVDLRRPFTVELWTKLTPGSTRHWLAGNLVFLPPSPGDTEVVPAGWQWWLEETATDRWRISLTTRIGFFVDVNFDPARWHHLAVCGDGEQLYLLLDGELVGRKPAELLLGGWTESPLNLHLSAHARMLPQQRGGLNGDVRWARLSSTDRYTTNFVPETELASDAETLALFDFERIEGPTVVDRSGNARDGKLTGSLRVVAAGYPPAMDATASKPDTTDVATAAQTPANPAAMPNDPAGASPLTPKSPPARAEVPNSDDLREATRKAREVFAAEIEAAKTIVQKAALAQKLVATARDSGDDSVARYALLELAREYEVQAGRLPQVFAIVDEVAAGFEVEPLAAKVESLKELSAPNAKAPIAPPVLAKAAMALTEQAMIQGQFDLASETARLAYAAANRGKDNALKTLARVRRDELNALKRNWELAQAAREKLDTAPDDPQWNLTWGKFLALQQREWAAAAPFLVKSGDEVWRPIGDAETASPQQAAEQRKLGDMLWLAAQDAAKRERDSLLIRARHWYTQAQPQLGGLELAALDKRIEELDAQLPLDWATAASSGEVIGGILPPGPMPAARYIGLLGRISVDGADAAAQMRYRNGFVIGDAKIRDLLAGFGKPAGRLQLEFHGMLHVPENLTVLVRHQGGSDQGGLHSLYLNGRKLGDVGGENLTKNDVYRLELEPGEYAIRWVLTGGDLGSSSVLFANSQTAEPLVLYHTPVMLAAMRRLPTRFAVDMTGN